MPSPTPAYRLHGNAVLREPHSLLAAPGCAVIIDRSGDGVYRRPNDDIIGGLLARSSINVSTTFEARALDAATLRRCGWGTPERARPRTNRIVRWLMVPLVASVLGLARSMAVR